MANNQAAMALAVAAAGAGLAFLVQRGLDQAEESSEEEGKGQTVVVPGGGFATGDGGGFAVGRSAQAGAAAGRQAGAGSPGGSPTIQLSPETEKELVSQQAQATEKALAGQQEVFEEQKAAARAQEESSDVQNIVASGIGAGAALGTPVGVGTGLGLAGVKLLDDSGAYDAIEGHGQGFAQEHPTAAKTLGTVALPLSVPGAVATGLVGRGSITENLGRAVEGSFLGGIF